MQRGLAHRPPKLAHTRGEAIALVFTELSLLGAVGLFALLVLTGLMVTILPADAPWAGVIGGPIMMFSAVGAYWGFERMSARPDAPPPLVPVAERLPWSRTLGVVGLHVGAAVAGSMVIGMVQELLFEPVTEQGQILELIASGDRASLVMLGLAAVVLAPLGEEALFRGLLFRRLMTRGLALAAWTLPALLFAAMHGNWVGLAVYAWLGLVFAHAYLRTGRLFAAILTHAGSNAITLSILLLAPPPELEALEQGSETGPELVQQQAGDDSSAQ